MHLKSLLYIGGILLLFSCKKDGALWQVQNLNPDNKTLAFGHGGMGTKYRFPMNSMESLNKVLAIHADGTEMDLQLSKDNEMVLFHNNNLQDACRAEGMVRNKNWEEIKNTNYKWPLLESSKLIRMSDFFDQVKITPNHIFTFDCKVEAQEDQDYLRNFADKLYALILQYNLVDQCFIESYNIDFLKNLEAKNPKLKLFVHCNTLTDGLSVSRQVHLYGLTMDRLKISQEEIALAHQNNLHITLYNMVNANENIKAIQMNADFLQSDKMEHLIEVLKN